MGSSHASIFIIDERFMPNISIANIKYQVLKHPRIVSRLPPHFETVTLSVQDLSLYLETPEIKKLIKLALDRLSGRIFVDLNTENYTLTLGFENHQERSFFMLLLPPGWQEK